MAELVPARSAEVTHVTAEGTSAVAPPPGSPAEPLPAAAMPAAAPPISSDVPAPTSTLTVSRAWQVPRLPAGPADLTLEHLPVPAAASLGERDVLVRVTTSEITYTDFVVMKGVFPPPYWRKGTPLTPGCSLVGRVAAVGSAVSRFAVGDRVAALPMAGGLATHAVLPEAACIKIDAAPPGAPAGDEAIVGIMTGVTAWYLLHGTAAARVLAARGAVDVRILVHACTGGTGSAIVQVARALGVPAANIFGTCSAANIETARASLGIEAFDYRGAAGGEAAWDARVRAATGGGGVDIVFDGVTIGGERYYARGMGVLGRGGAWVGYGFTNAAAPGTVATAAIAGLFMRTAWQRMTGCCCASRKSAELWLGVKPSDTAAYEAGVRAVLSMIADGRLRPLVGRVWRLEEARDALLAFAAAPHVGKQLVHVADD